MLSLWQSPLNSYFPENGFKTAVGFSYVHVSSTNEQLQAEILKKYTKFINKFTYTIYTIYIQCLIGIFRLDVGWIGCNILGKQVGE